MSDIQEKLNRVASQMLDARVIKGIPYIITYILNPMAKNVEEPCLAIPDPEVLDRNIAIYVHDKTVNIAKKQMAQLGGSPTSSSSGPSAVQGRTLPDYLHEENWFLTANFECLIQPGKTPVIFDFVIKSVNLLSQKPNIRFILDLANNDYRFRFCIEYIYFMIWIIHSRLPAGIEQRDLENTSASFQRTLSSCLDILTCNFASAYDFQMSLMSQLTLYYQRRKDGMGRASKQEGKFEDNCKVFIKPKDNIDSSTYYSVMMTTYNQSQHQDPKLTTFLNKYILVDDLMTSARQMQLNFSVGFTETLREKFVSADKAINNHEDRLYYYNQAVVQANSEGSQVQIFDLKRESLGRINRGVLVTKKSDYKFTLQVDYKCLNLSEKTKSMLDPEVINDEKRYMDVSDFLNVAEPGQAVQYQSIFDITAGAFEGLTDAARNYMAMAQGTTERGITVPGYRRGQGNIARRDIRTMVQNENPDDKLDVAELLALRRSLMSEDSNRKNFFSRNKYYPISYRTRDEAGKEQGISRRNSELTLIFTIQIYLCWFTDDAHVPSRSSTATKKFTTELEGNKELLFLKEGRRFKRITKIMNDGNSEIYTKYLSYLGKIDALYAEAVKIRGERAEQMDQGISNALNRGENQRVNSFENKNMLVRGLHWAAKTSEYKQYNQSKSLDDLRGDDRNAINEFLKQNTIMRAAKKAMNTEDYRRAVKAQSRMQSRDERAIYQAKNEARKINDHYNEIMRSQQAKLRPIQNEFKAYLEMRKKKTDNFKNFDPLST